MERKRTERKRKLEGKEASGDQFVGGRKEKREKKERKERKERKKRKKKREKKKIRGREPDQRRAVVGPRHAWNVTVLRDVGVFLTRFYSTPRGRVMAYGFRPVSGRICMLWGMFAIVGLSWTEYMSSQDSSTASRN